MADLDKIAESLSNLTILEASELTKILEENGVFQQQLKLLLQPHQLVATLEVQPPRKKKLNLMSS